MIDTVNLHLRPGDRIEVHDGPAVPYLTIRTADYRHTVHVFLGTLTGEGDHEAAWRQLDELEAAVIAARRLLMRHVDGPVPGPDDPTDEPTDEPTSTGSELLEVAMDTILAESGVHRQAHPLTEAEHRLLDGNR